MMQAVAAGDDASVLRHIDHRINQDALPASWVYFFSAAFFSAGAWTAISPSTSSGTMMLA